MNDIDLTPDAGEPEFDNLLTRVEHAVNTGSDDEVRDLRKALGEHVTAAAADTDADTRRRQLRALLEAGLKGGPDAVRKRIVEQTDAERQHAIPMHAVNDTLPPAILRCDGKGGAVLVSGEVCLLAGEGGIGKSIYAQRLAYDMATGEAGSGGLLFPNLPTDGAPVIFATAEDSPAVVKHNAELIQTHRGDNAMTTALHLIDLRDRPLFGVDAQRHLLTRPETLGGYGDLQRAMEKIRPRLVIIDPAMAVFVAEQNNAAMVRLFLSSLRRAAEQHDCGIMVLAHSNKAARKAQGGEVDALDPGMVAGSTAWTDGVRGVLSMTYNDNDDNANRMLTVMKANYGPRKIACALRPEHDAKSNKIVAMNAAGPWTVVDTATPTGNRGKGGSNMTHVQSNSPAASGGKPNARKRKRV